MTYRNLLFFLLLTGCMAEQPSGTHDPPQSEVVTVVEETPTPDADPMLVREITTPTGRYLTGSASAITGRLLSGARPQVQWLQSEEAGFRGRFLKVIPAPGVLLSSEDLLTDYLRAIGAKLALTDTLNHQLYLRADGIREDIIIGSTGYPGEWSEAASQDTLIKLGLHVRNATGYPLLLSPGVLDFYLPSLQQHFGESLPEVDFFLEADTLIGVRLVTN